MAAAAPPGISKTRRQGRERPPTVQDVVSHRLAALAQAHWAPGSHAEGRFDASLVEDIYRNELSADVASTDAGSTTTPVAILEFSQYLENYLWPHYDESSSFAHVMSIVLLVNEKARDSSLSVWESFRSRPEHELAAFLNRVFGLVFQQRGMSYAEKTAFVLFLINCFQTLEDRVVRESCVRLVHLPMWRHLSEFMRQRQLRHFPELRSSWESIEHKDRGGGSDHDLEGDFTASLLNMFFEALRDACHRGDRVGEEKQGESAAASKADKKRKSGPQAESSAQKRIHSSPTQDNGEDDKRVGIDELRWMDEGGAVPSARPSELMIHHNSGAIRVVERVLELCIDLLSQLHTRRFFKPLLEDCHFVVRCQLSALSRQSRCISEGGLVDDDLVGLDNEGESTGGAEENAARVSATKTAVYSGGLVDSGHRFVGAGKLFNQMLEMVKFYEGFEIDDKNGVPLTDSSMIASFSARLERLQRIAFKYFRAQLLPLALGTLSGIETRESLTQHLEGLDMPQLRELCGLMRLLPPSSFKERTERPGVQLEEAEQSRVFLMEILIYHVQRRPSQKQLVRVLPLYPSEDVLWDENVVPSQHYSGDRPLALPKLNLQFLTMHDYLLRNFLLYRLESTYAIRQDIATAVRLLQPRLSAARSQTVFTGFARYAVPLTAFSVTKVRKAKVGEDVPALVQAEITISLSPFTGLLRREWEQLKKHDVLFLLAVEATVEMGVQGEQRSLPVSVYPNLDELDQKSLGVTRVRGCEIYEVLDESKTVIGERDKSGNLKRAVGNLRTYRVTLDAAQYQLDLQRMTQESDSSSTTRPDIYSSFNLVLRRPSKENNFKAVLQTIRDLMQSETAKMVPDWLHDVFLGYGDPTSVRYYKLNHPNHRQLQAINFNDTFLDADHVRRSFPGAEIRFDGARLATASPPYRLSFTLGRSPPYKRLLLTSVSQVHSQAQLQGAVAMETGGEAIGESGTEREGGEEGKEDDEGRPLSSREIPKLKIADLKQHLARRGLSTEGLKKALVERLTEAVQRESQRVERGRERKRQRAPSTKEMENEVKEEASEPDVIVVTPYPRKGAGLFASHVGKRNAIRFTPMQVEAIKSGLNPGFTLIVGPPGTGKTDVAVQIMSELYHNFPNERTLVITHSNHALNDLFSKIMERDIDERYLLRLGHGEEELGLGRDFSRFGRINYMLERRMALLESVASLARSMDLPDDAAYTCEAAQHFFHYHVQGRWEEFFAKVEAALKKQRTKSADAPTAEDVQSLVRETFPFSRFLTSVEHPTFFDGQNAEQDMETAKEKFHYIESIFDELREIEPFEVLRTGRERGNYVLTKHAKVIAMTCTHAAIQRSQLLDLGFHYDNLIMEEAAQVLEIETFIPMLLQAHDPEAGCRLRRVILLGDHHQLPPIIQNAAFQKYSRMEQSMFSRMIRLGMPALQLNAQGRMRPSLAKLWNWRYKYMQDLDIVAPQPLEEGPEKKVAAVPGSEGRLTSDSRFSLANGGFAFDFQFVNVDDFMGQGESTPAPFYYQNLGEAEYVVQVYMYMRLLGYPAGSISIITSYNGQRDLIEDVVNQRCATNPLFGPPAKISTVDKFQGQQNDYILLSLVRTRNPGHIRDIRRLVVAMSRARLGLYLFGRQSLFQNCLELSPVFNIFLTRPTELALVRSEESMHTSRQVEDAVPSEHILAVSGVEQMGQLVSELTQSVMADYARRQKQYEEFQRRQQAEKEAEQRELERQRAVAEQEASDSRVEEEMQRKAQEEARAERQMQEAVEEEKDDEVLG